MCRWVLYNIKMSKVFWDDIVNLDKVERYIKRVSKSFEEREEYYRIIDEIIHHRVMGCILERLPEQDHSHFLKRFSKKPYDSSHFKFLGKRISEDVEEFIKAEMEMLAEELVDIFEGRRKLKAAN